MGRKSARPASSSSSAAPAASEPRLPTCYYCFNTYSSEDDLVLHQKATHFRCPDCGRRFLGTDRWRGRHR